MARVHNFDHPVPARSSAAKREAAPYHRLPGDPAPIYGKDGRILGVPIEPLIREKARRNPEFRNGLIREAVECMLNGEVSVGNAVLRDYVNGAISFEKLSKATNIPPKSLMRMFSAKGNAQSKNLFAVLAAMQKIGKFKLEVRAKDY
jgi:hypothetical protein